ncbi:MAG TPA: PP2C family protein-serine/threonine phosphatase [Thermoanaerobaculia bacterium]|nr:PP2C family protein-serine/threonine phosphatase [Thermoanaerobaculia bacterium]
MTGKELPAPRRRPPPRVLAVYFALAMALGVVISVLVSRGDVSLPVVAVGAFVGAVVFPCSYLFGVLVEPWSLRLPRAVGSALLALAYALGGTVGSLLGLAAGRALVLGAPLALPPVSGLAIVPAVTAFLALAVALPARAYEALKGRLSDSIERLKAAEYAEKELELARAIQQRLLPPASLSGPGYAVAARNVPARHVGGDFYDVFRRDDGRLGLAVADVAGKGMGAALIMATAKAVVPLLAAGCGPAATLAALNEKLLRELSRREFVALATGVFDAATGLLVVANAGLPEPFLVGRSGAVRPLVSPGPRYPLGVKANVAWEELSVTLGPGERVVFLTDGLPEAPGPGGEPIGYAALERLLDVSAARSADEAAETILSRVTSAGGGPLEADETVLVLERTAGAV